MKVLVDTSVLSHAVRLQRFQEARTVEWGGATRKWFATVLEPKPAEPGWLQEEIDALPRIAAFAREGRLQLFTSPEIDFELWEGPPDGMRRTSLSLFQGVELHRAPAPFNYTRVVASYLDRPADPKIRRPSDAKARRRRFFATLNEPGFSELRRALGAKRAADAFHILTAERAGLSVFLTDDDSLLKRVARIKVDLEVRVLAPTQLLDAVASAV